MTSNQTVIHQEDERTPAAAHAPMPSRAAWLQVALNVAYVLLAGPRGLGYVLLLAIGLALDLLWLTIHLLLAATLGLLSTTARALVWLLRFLWVGTRTLFVWVVQKPWRLLVSSVHGVRHMVSGMLQDPTHLHATWHRALSSLRRDPERIRTRRPVRTARSPLPALSIRERAVRFFGACAGRVKRMTRRVVPERWVIFPVICWWLVMWERRHTMRWLNIELPSLEAPRHTPVDRTAHIAQVPIGSLGYVLAKVPLGALAVVAIILAGGVVGAAAEADTPEMVVLLVAMVLALVVIYILNMLAQLSARFAQRVFSPSPAVRRLQAAEALAAQARMQAERAEQSRRDLIINVGHELRTPTASILGHVESLLLALDSPDSHLQPETLRLYLTIVEREAERLSSLVDDLLAVARAERAELQLALAPVNAAEVIHEVYQALAPLARRERQVVLVYQEQPGLPYVHADRQRLSQVLLNLVRNAITYTPAGGIVSIGLRRTHSDWVLLTVADTGSGIAPGDLDRVFERFYRTDASRARSSGGFGLGLAIARDLVEAMGGTITVKSVVGEGSCFQVSLPIFNASQLRPAV